MDLARVYREFIADRLLKQDALSVFERHHILPRCLGGGDEFENIVRLIPEEHLFAHILLGRIHGGKLAVSAVRMLGMKKYAGRRSRLRYASLRIQHKEALTGVKRSPEVCAKIGAAHKGKTVSQETRRKLSNARARQVITPEHAAAIGRANKGNRNGCNPSAATREKIAASVRGQKRRLGAKHSSETIQKLRDAALRRYARERGE